MLCLMIDAVQNLEWYIQVFDSLTHQLLSVDIGCLFQAPYSSLLIPVYYSFQNPIQTAAVKEEYNTFDLVMSVY